MHNLARISREATTVRRVLEAIFRYFDNNNLWSPSKGLALCVLLDMQIVMEKSGIHYFLLLYFLDVIFLFYLYTFYFYVILACLSSIIANVDRGLHYCLAGQNAHILLSMLVKHLEHKNVLKQPDMILDIIEVTARLAEHSKAQSSTAIMAAISDMVRHLGKSMQSLVSDAGPGDDMVKWNNR